MGTDLREALSSAMDRGDVSVSETPAPEVAVETATPAPVVETPEAEAKPVDTRVRDAEGKFAPKPKDTTPPPKPNGKPKGALEAPPALEAKPTTETPAETPAAPVVALKAPQSWTPAVREKWAALPPEVQAEVARREKETSAALHESARARQVAQELEHTLKPYIPLIQQQGGTAMGTISSLMQTAAGLYSGPVQSRAAVLVKAMQGAGITVDALADALDANGGAGHAPAPAEYRDPRLDGLLAEIEGIKAQKTQAQQQQALSAVQEFQADAPEFLEDVREIMADLLEVAGRRGVELSLKDAYSQACRMDPRVAGVYAQREAAKAAATATAATQRAKAAGSSVKSTPGGDATPKKPEGIRGTLEAAFDARNV